jgi:lipopolysaccharide export system ATP-binding protein
MARAAHISTSDSALLEVVELHKSYRGRRVVNGVSFEVAAGEIVGLLGPNGAGKTTSFRMAVGLIRPDGGQVFLGGVECSRLPMFRRARLGMGYLPQEPSVFRKLGVRDNLLAVLETLPIDRAERRLRCDELIAELDLGHLGNAPAETLSGGERRRLEISRALAAKPSLLLLDEPFAGVDPIAVEEIQSIVSKLREQGIGILITDHNVRETLLSTDRAYIIHQGKILRQGTAAELVADPEVRRVYLGSSFDAPLGGLTSPPAGLGAASAAPEAPAPARTPRPLPITAAEPEPPPGSAPEDSEAPPAPLEAPRRRRRRPLE